MGGGGGGGPYIPIVSEVKNGLDAVARQIGNPMEGGEQSVFRVAGRDIYNATEALRTFEEAANPFKGAERARKAADDAARDEAAAREQDRLNDLAQRQRDDIAGSMMGMAARTFGSKKATAYAGLTDDEDLLGL
ncbi:MAG: hypothetical protein ACRCV5_16515 [Afipia sp.]